jgi:hypothetical protein
MLTSEVKRPCKRSFGGDIGFRLSLPPRSWHLRWKAARRVSRATPHLRLRSTGDATQQTQITAPDDPSVHILGSRLRLV